MYLVLLGKQSGLVGIHPESGKLLWQYKGIGASGGVAQIPIPIVKDDKVWVSCSYSPPGAGSALLEIVPKTTGNEFEAKVIKTYEKKELNNHHGGMVLVGDYIYFSTRPRTPATRYASKIQNGRDQVGPGETPGRGPRGRRLSSTPTTGSTSGTRTAKWSSPSRTRRS